ncbi:hypothetical protein [Okeania sp. SIO1I7]|nr:hypothetical protein [Okeania sp. SIO1I7]NET26892.1 hypothetical protein [Okeania sp. SIO1I7]
MLEILFYAASFQFGISFFMSKKVPSFWLLSSQNDEILTLTIRKYDRDK